MGGRQVEENRLKGLVRGSGGMTKAELVEQVARNTQVTKKHAERIVNTVFESIVDSLRDGEKIELRGFGSFRIRERGSRIGRIPKTGARVNVPSKKIPYFKPASSSRNSSTAELSVACSRRSDDRWSQMQAAARHRIVPAEAGLASGFVSPNP